MDLIFLQKQDCTFSFHANTSLKYPFCVREPSEYTITPHPVYQTPGPAWPSGRACLCGPRPKATTVTEPPIAGPLGHWAVPQSSPPKSNHRHPATNSGPARPLGGASVGPAQVRKGQPVKGLWTAVERGCGVESEVGGGSQPAPWGPPAP